MSDKIVQLQAPEPQTVQQVVDALCESLNFFINEEGMSHEHVIGILEKIKLAYLFECFEEGEEE